VRERLAVLEGAHNCRFHVHRADVADAEQVQRLVARFGSDLPELRGVIHAAGVLDDGVITEQRWDRFESVLKPKLGSAWHLHQATRLRQLDFLVLYSSIAAVVGSAGQSNYATANASLIGLAQHRRALGLPATSIAWGPWADIGMAARSADRALL